MGNYFYNQDQTLTIDKNYPTVKEKLNIAQKRLDYLEKHSTVKEKLNIAQKRLDYFEKQSKTKSTDVANESTQSPQIYTKKEHDQYIQDLIN